MDISYYKKYEPISNHWYIESELGRGSYGVVFKARREDFGRTYHSALKIISIPASRAELDSFKSENFGISDESITSYFMGFVEEFAKEFHLMEELKGNTNIVSYEDHEVIKKENEFGWDIFIRMELLLPMTEHFQNINAGEAEVIKVGKDICRALEVCVKHNIIHRDIKPSNVFVSKDGYYKLGDFGVARTLEKSSASMSKKGTYTYMAPEVFKGEPYDHTVDIYSLGIMMYRQLNDGFEPFRNDLTFNDGENALAKRMSGSCELPAPKHASEKLSRIILKACAYKKEDRFASPSEFKQALELYELSLAHGKEDIIVFDTPDSGIRGCGETEADVNYVRGEAAKTSCGAVGAVPFDPNKTVGISSAPATPIPYDPPGAAPSGLGVGVRSIPSKAIRQPDGSGFISPLVPMSEASVPAPVSPEAEDPDATVRTSGGREVSRSLGSSVAGPFGPPTAPPYHPANPENEGGTPYTNVTPGGLRSTMTPSKGTSEPPCPDKKTAPASTSSFFRSPNNNDL